MIPQADTDAVFQLSLLRILPSTWLALDTSSRIGSFICYTDRLY